MFVKGQPKTGGRRKGSRDRISRALLEALADDFEKYGAEAVKICRVERPAEYLKLCASLVPVAFDENSTPQLAITSITRQIVDMRDFKHTPVIEDEPTAAVRLLKAPDAE